MAPGDDDLRRRFERLRDEDAANATPVDQVVARARAAAHAAPRRGRARLLAIGAAIAITALALAWFVGAPPGVAPSDRGAPAAPTAADVAALERLDLERLGSLRTPSDALLDVAGTDLLGVRPPELLRLPEIPEAAPERSSIPSRRTFS